MGSLGEPVLLEEYSEWRRENGLLPDSGGENVVASSGCSGIDGLGCLGTSFSGMVVIFIDALMEYYERQ